MTESRAVILDMDAGIDDAIAVLYLASRPHVTISGRRACPLHDPTAAAVYADPDLVTESYDANVDVACSDDARGTTVVDRRAGGKPAFITRRPPTRVITGVDVDRFVTDLTAVLLG